MSGIRVYDPETSREHLAARGRRYALTGFLDRRSMPHRVIVTVLDARRVHRFRPLALCVRYFATQFHQYEVREQRSGHHMIYRDGVPIQPVSTIADADQWLTREVIQYA